MKHLLTVVTVSLLAAGGNLFGQISHPASTQPAYPLWDGKETVNAYAKRAGIKDVQVELKLDANVSLKLTLIPAGKFLMGSPIEEQIRTRKEATAAGDWLKDEGPQHEVTISRPFFMGAFHVTKGQFAKFVADSGYKTDAENGGKAWGWDGPKFGMVTGISWRKTGFDQTDDHPVVNVTHNDAIAFCNWLSRKINKKVTLPTEAQWEYACRAGTSTAYQWGDDPNGGKGWFNTRDQATNRQIPQWKGYSDWDDGYAFTSPVGKFKPNAFNLYDMHGNAWQWCADWYDDKYYENTANVDPQGPESGEKRVLRGGSWSFGSSICRSASRGRKPPSWWWNFIGFDLGFRVVVLLD